MADKVIMTMDKMQKYEDIRQSGLTNMFDITAVMALSCGILTKADCLDIMKNYSYYMQQFNIER